jgi:hypothetical protein
MAGVFQTLVAASLCWFLSSSLWIYPHSLSYFNESIGGPLNGPKHLLGSNVDWGQDLLYLKRWRDAHAGTNRMVTTCVGGFSEELLGFVPADLADRVPDDDKRAAWRAVGARDVVKPGDDEPRPSLLDYPPVGRAGYSIRVFEVGDP